MKRRALALLLALFLIVLAAACGNGSDQETETETPVGGDAEQTPEPRPVFQTTVEDEEVEDNFEVQVIVGEVDEFNAGRGEHMLIVYSPMRGETTQTNPYGYEAVVENGRVVSLGGNNNTIPQNGVVVSGNGGAERWMKEHILPGSAIATSREDYSITVTNDKQAYMNAAKQVYRDVKDTLEEFREHNTIAAEADTRMAGIEALFAELRAARTGEAVIESYEAIKSESAESLNFVVPSFAEETRAIWVISKNESRERVRRNMERYAEAGFNTVMLDVFSHGYVIYPDSEYVRQRPDSKNGFDLLQEYIDLGKELGIDIHAWTTTFFVGEPSFRYDDNRSGSPIIDDHPDWVSMRRDGTAYAGIHEDGFIWLSQTNPDVQEFLLGMYNEIIERYDVKGINLDYIRTSVGSDHADLSMGFEPSAVEAFKAESGIDITTITDVHSEEWAQFSAWRAGHITDLVHRIKANMERVTAETGKELYLSACTVDDWEHAIRGKSQNWKAWLEDGVLDFICPMAYLPNPEGVANVVYSMVNGFPGSLNVTGLNFNMGNEQITRQIMAARRAGAVGVCFFFSDHLNPRRIALLNEGVFRTPATPVYTR